MSSSARTLEFVVGQRPKSFEQLGQIARSVDRGATRRRLQRKVQSSTRCGGTRREGGCPRGVDEAAGATELTTGLRGEAESPFRHPPETLAPCASGLKRVR